MSQLGEHVFFGVYGFMYKNQLDAIATSVAINKVLMSQLMTPIAT